MTDVIAIAELARRSVLVRTMALPILPITPRERRFEHSARLTRRPRSIRVLIGACEMNDVAGSLLSKTAGRR